MMVAAAVVGLAVLLLAALLARRAPKKFLNKERQQLTLTKKEYISHDTLHLTFTLPKATPVLGLPTGKHFKIFAPNVAGKVKGEWNGREDMSAEEPEIHRMYTPVTSDRDLGKVELVLKEYKGGVNEKCARGRPRVHRRPRRRDAPPAELAPHPLTPRPGPEPEPCALPQSWTVASCRSTWRRSRRARPSPSRDHRACTSTWAEASSRAARSSSPAPSSA